MHEPFDPTIIIFAVLTLFVLYKLRSVLGSRNEIDRRPPEPLARRADDRRPPSPAAANDSNVIRLPNASSPPAGSPPRPSATPADRWSASASEKAWPGLDAILAADASFSARDFLGGAGAAYEMIVVAFAAGDLTTLRRLLDDEVFESFEASIKARQAAGRKAETTFVSLDKTSIDDAALRGGAAQISVRFLSKIISATRDASGAVVEGSADRIIDMVDLWTFSRPVASRDPNWKLIATETAH